MIARFLQLLLLFAVILVQTGVAQASEKEQAAILVSGKWINKSDGYVPIATYDTKAAKDDDDVRTVKRYKTFGFESDNSFVLDSAKQRYTGRWTIVDNKVHLHFNSKVATHLRKNTNPNASSAGYLTEEENLQLSDRVLVFKSQDVLVGDGFEYKNYSQAVSGLFNFYEFSGFANVTWGHIIMMIVGLFFIFLAIRYNFEPLLLIPIGIGILIGNVPMFQAVDFNLQLGVYEPGSVMNYLYKGVVQGWYPPLIFLGIGAMTDFSSLISNPKLMLLGAAAQIGIFLTFLGALWLGFAPPEAGAIGIIGGADGPTAIFLSSKLANGINVLANGETVKNLIGPIAIAAYSYMALVPVIQPPVIKLLTSKRERKNENEASAGGIKNGKNHFSIDWFVIDCLYCANIATIIGNVVFWKPFKRIRGYQPFGKCCFQLVNRHNQHTSWNYCWGINTGRCFPYAFIYKNIWLRGRFVYNCNRRWCSWSKTYECFP